jgi:alkanesulfonate monooxygenase SsuD/methylene tetrahydromethanopterin reductase-like flavin-dependent oxidoreductase (luciferase family)
MLKFGIFDHLDENGVPRGQQFDDRLKLVELIEQAGFRAYHLAEHHSTPLGCAPSPSVFLGAVAQRTKTLRFGPLVYLLPLYHPLRVYEETCMLDHLSGGRFELGVGRGGALIEHNRYGVASDVAGPMYHEAYALLMRTFQADAVDFTGRFFNVKDYLTITKPVQRPHPPVWYGCNTPDAAAWAAKEGVNIVSLGPAARACEIGQRYRDEWTAAGKSRDTLPMIGITRHIVVAETDQEAERIARAAYARWRESIEYLFKRTAGPEFPLTTIYPLEWDDLRDIGHGFAGSPSRVQRDIAELQRQTGISYLVCQMVFGTMSYADAARSITLFGREVAPAFARTPSMAAS